MNLKDYLLNTDDVEWPVVLKDWTWILPPRFKVWMVSRFGDLFLIQENGSVWMLDLSAGTFDILAKDKIDFCQKADEDDNANTWLMIPLVNQLVESSVVPSSGQCYGFKVPTALGGDYTIDNCCAIPLVDYVKGMGSIHRQIANVPDGTHVTIEIIH